MSLKASQVFYNCLYFYSLNSTYDDSDNDDDLFVNTNHPPPIEVHDTTSSDSDF